jgi:GxxExxY protein
MRVEAEVMIEVWYDGLRVGDFRADLLVEQRVIVEIKASHLLSDSDWKQLLNYLRATELEIGLLCHFGPKAAFKRLIYSNPKKTEHLARA